MVNIILISLSVHISIGIFSPVNLYAMGLIDYHPLPIQVAGYAIGGGHVLHMVCDLTIAADNAVFGQTGPKVLIICLDVFLF